MTKQGNISRILAAAILSASAVLLSQAPAHASVNSETQATGQVIIGSDIEAFSIIQGVRTFLDDGYSLNTTIDAGNDALVRVSGVRKVKRNSAPRRQSTTGPNGTRSLSYGGGQRPMQAGAGDEFKKFFKKMPKPHCGGKHSIC